MKRSEMIEIIEDFLWKSNGEYGYKKLAKEDAVQLLKIIEDEGMKPPWSSKIRTHPDYPLDAYEWDEE